MSHGRWKCRLCRKLERLGVPWAAPDSLPGVLRGLSLDGQDFVRFEVSHGTALVYLCKGKVDRDPEVPACRLVGSFAVERLLSSLEGWITRHERTRRELRSGNPRGPLYRPAEALPTFLGFLSGLQAAPSGPW